MADSGFSSHGKALIPVSMNPVTGPLRSPYNELNESWDSTASDAIIDREGIAEGMPGAGKKRKGGRAQRTHEKGWFGKLARAYRERTPIFVVDDANVGIDPATDSLISIGLKVGLSPGEWTAVGISIGISAAGITMVFLAFLDPEPTSKLGLLVGGGAVCVKTGGFSAVRILTKLRPPNVSM
jgi:hypothetical protein